MARRRQQNHRSVAHAVVTEAKRCQQRIVGWHEFEGLPLRARQLDVLAQEPVSLGIWCIESLPLRLAHQSFRLWHMRNSADVIEVQMRNDDFADVGR